MNQRFERFPVRAVATAVTTAAIGIAAGLSWPSALVTALVGGVAVLVIETVLAPRNAALGNFAMLCLVVAAWSLVLVACSGSDDGGRSSAESGEGPSGAGAAGAAAESPDALAASLLSIDDMGDGWTEQPVDEGGEDADLCVYVDDDTLAVGDLEWAHRLLSTQGAGGGTLVFESLTVVPEGQGPEAFAALREQVTACGERERERDGYTEIYRQLELGEFGDESLAMSAGTIVGGVETPLHSNILYARLGDVIMSLSVTQTDGGGIEMWAPPAIEKIEATLLAESPG